MSSGCSLTTAVVAREQPPLAMNSAASKSSMTTSRFSNSFSLAAGIGMAMRRLVSLRASSMARNWPDEQSNISTRSFSVGVRGHCC